MIVLADLEWIDMGGRYLTQLAAIRTDENWEVVSRFNSYMCPPENCLASGVHLAFGGLPISVYERAPSEKEVVRNFFKWLEPTDTVWTWAASNARYLEKLGKSRFSVRSAAYKARTLAGESNGACRDPYDILGSSQSLPMPKHRAENDVEAMRLLFSRLQMTEDSVPEAPKASPKPGPDDKTAWREKRIQAIENANYGVHFANRKINIKQKKMMRTQNFKLKYREFRDMLKS